MAFAVAASRVGESSNSSSVNPQQAAAEHVNGVVGKVEREAATARDPHHGVVLPEHRGARGHSGLDDVRRSGTEGGPNLVALAMSGWVENLRALPDATVELKGGASRPVHARAVTGEDRERM
jgi:hypothetical protein